MKDTNANWAKKQIIMHGRDRYPTVHEQFIKLVEEVGELGKEVNRASNPDRLRSECADVALALYNLCDKLQIDLDQSIRDVVTKDQRKFL